MKNRSIKFSREIFLHKLLMLNIMPITSLIGQWFKQKIRLKYCWYFVMTFVFCFLLLFVWVWSFVFLLGSNTLKIFSAELISISSSYTVKNKKVTLYPTFPSALPSSVQLMEANLQVHVPTNKFQPRILQIFPALHPMSIV